MSEKTKQPIKGKKYLFNVLTELQLSWQHISANKYMFCTAENFILLYKQNVGSNLLVMFNLFFIAT